MSIADDVRESLARLDGWVTAHEYAGYEPFDGLNSYLRPLAVGRPGRQVLVQLALRSPFNLRPLLGIAPATSTKAMGYFARGYLTLYAVDGDSTWLKKANACLDWLRLHQSPNQPGASWGNHFDYQTRAYYLEKGGPTVVWTVLVGHAFIDAYEQLGRPEDLTTAKEAARFILEGLERRVERDGACISYVPGSYVAIHNANMLAAGFLARLYCHDRSDVYRQVAAEAVAYSVGGQRPDGSWWYAEDPMFHWVDNWHSAYVLDSLWYYIRGTGDSRYVENFQRGVRFWLDHFFLPDGTPRFYANRTFPIDIQCASQAIESLCLYADVYDPTCFELATRVARWTIANMQDSDGHFYFRRSPGWVNRTPMLHWGQATMLHGLARLVSRLSLVGKNKLSTMNESTTSIEP